MFNWSSLPVYVRNFFMEQEENDDIYEEVYNSEDISIDFTTWQCLEEMRTESQNTEINRRCRERWETRTESYRQRCIDRAFLDFSRDEFNRKKAAAFFRKLYPDKMPEDAGHLPEFFG